MKVAVPPSTPTVFKKVRMMVRRMMEATAVPKMRAGRSRTTNAASGAAMTRPMRSAATMLQGISAKLRPMKNPMLAATDTKNSLVSTVPTTLRGSILPVDINVEVFMAPQPPPPAASRNPATRPSGERNLREIGLTTTGRWFLRNAKRKRMYTPRRKRNRATKGFAASAEMALTAKAPPKAPIAPGTVSQPILPQSTLPNLQWEIPDAAVVATSEMCTLAEASAGATPTTKSKVADDAPYPIPSEPSTNWAIKPTIPSINKLRTSPGLLLHFAY